LNTIDAIGKAGATFKVLAVPALDTSGPYGQLLISILGAIATFERELILSRTKEGRQRARLNGVRFGRKRKLTSHQIAQAKAMRAEGKSLTEIARTFNTAHSTIGRAVNER
jgi:DNA invertase Pin-like site-specific DNA recombinase